MLSSLLPPIYGNEQGRMRVGQEEQSNLCNKRLSFIQNDLRPTLGRALHRLETKDVTVGRAP